MTQLAPALLQELSTAITQLHADAELFSSAQLPAERFRGRRVAHGIYEQRSSGSYMLRVRLPAGVLHAKQLLGLAKLAKEAGAPRLHITTRQDIQFHDLPLDAALRVQLGLLELGLTTYGSGGSTVRNIVTEPLSGVSTDEEFDVRPYALELSSYFAAPTQQPSLPRKIKIAFSASTADRADARLADLGFIAKWQANAKGFQVFIGGGLGLGSVTGLELLSWIPADQVPRVTQEVLLLFATHGDRTNRHKARLRHLRRRLGDDEFLKLCHQYVKTAPQHPSSANATDFTTYSTTVGDSALPSQPAPLPTELEGNRHIVAERDIGRYSVRFTPLHGDVQADILATFAKVANEFTSPFVRLGLEQDLWLTGIGGNTVELLLERLNGLGLGTPLEPFQAIIACSGAATCQLGLLRSRAAADAVAAHLAENATPWTGEALRISGCPNACSRHLGAAIGFEGRTKRVGDRLLPSYAVFAGGQSTSTSRKLASLVGVIPAKRLPEVVLALRAATHGPRNHPTPATDVLKAIVERFSQLPTSIPEDWFIDWGTTKPLDLSELGEGECAATL